MSTSVPIREASPVTRAQRLLDIGRPAEALKILNALAADDPGNYDVLCRIAYAELALKHNAEALRAADAAIAAAPEKEWGHRLRSIALGRMNRLAEALASAQTARSVYPEEPITLYQLFCILRRCKRNAEAEEVLRDLLRIAPDSWYAHYASGSAALSRKDPAAAEQHFREALRIDPLSSETHNDLGVALLRQGKRKESVDAFWNAAKADPNSQHARDNIRVATVRKATLGTIALFLAFQLARFLGESSGLAGAFAAVAVFILIVWAVWRFHNRTTGLRPEIASYLREEKRRQTSRNVRVLGGILTASSTAIWGLLMLIEPLSRPSTVAGWSVFIGIAAASIWLMTRIVQKAERR